MEKYILNQNELASLIRYEILYKWHEWQKIVDEEREDFASYLLADTPYQPDHEFIQSFCETEEEKADPVAAGVYNDIRPADVANYQLKFYIKE
jgi:hypothetical protein